MTLDEMMDKLKRLASSPNIRAVPARYRELHKANIYSAAVAFGKTFQPVETVAIDLDTTGQRKVPMFDVFATCKVNPSARGRILANRTVFDGDSTD
jgi:hypothetical protein